MIQLFLQGGPLFMIPLFVASVGVITIGIERVIKYRRAEVDPEGFRAALQEELSDPQGQVDGDVDRSLEMRRCARGFSRSHASL